MANNIKQKMIALAGDQAVAFAAKQSDVDVVAAYPITPQTIIVEQFSEYVANGEVETEFVCVESEHSAMAASIAASATGARAFTASASAGLALMHEMLFVASGCRVPVVMAIANRALSAPLNIHGDHSDSMAQRDSGWIQIYAEKSNKVLLPVMVGLDGFTLSHTLENVETFSDETVKDFVGIRKIANVLTHEGKLAPFRLDPKNPMTMGPIALQNYYFEFKRQQEEAMSNALMVIQNINKEYGELSGRKYGNGLIDEYKLTDAEIAVICIGSTAGTMKTIVDQLRKEGIKAGLLRIRAFRPFPSEYIRAALKNVKAIAVMDKSMSFGGNGGPIFHEVRNSLYNSNPRPFIVNYIYGLGGRDTSPTQLRTIYSDLRQILTKQTINQSIKYLGLRD